MIKQREKKMGRFAVELQLANYSDVAHAESGALAADDGESEAPVVFVD